jgi:hypothetical protein
MANSSLYTAPVSTTTAKTTIDPVTGVATTVPPAGQATGPLAGMTNPTEWQKNSSTQNRVVNPQIPVGGFTFQGVGDRNLGTATNAAIQGQVTGSAYAPIGLSEQEAQRRAESNQRATDASAINRLGIQGQGIGQQIAANTDQQNLVNRFDTSLKIAQAKESMKNTGIQNAMNLSASEKALQTGQLNTAAQFGSDQDFMAAYKNIYGSDLDPASVAQARAAVKEGVRQTLETGILNNAQQRQNVLDQSTKNLHDVVSRSKTLNPDGSVNTTAMLADQSTQEALKKMWETQGNTGDVDSTWAKNQLRLLTDPQYSTQIGQLDTELKQMVASGLMDDNTAQTMMGIMRSGNTQFMRATQKLDDNGKPIPLTIGGVAQFDPKTKAPLYVMEYAPNENALNQATKGTVMANVNGTRTPVVEPDASTGYVAGNPFVGPDKQLYISKNGTIQKVDPKDIQKLTYDSNRGNQSKLILDSLFAQDKTGSAYKNAIAEFPAKKSDTITISDLNNKNPTMLELPDGTKVFGFTYGNATLESIQDAVTGEWYELQTQNSGDNELHGKQGNLYWRKKDNGSIVKG